MKLPKQWRNWCADQKLTPTSTKRSGKHSYFYLKGRGYFWRVNCHGCFQRGDTYEGFDRWALCEIIECKIPTTRESFRKSVAQLLKGGRKNTRCMPHLPTTTKELND